MSVSRDSRGGEAPRKLGHLSNWIGEVPASWEILPLKRVARIGSSGAGTSSMVGDSESSGVAYAPPDVLTGKELLIPRQWLREDVLRDVEVVQPGATIICTTASIGQCAQATVPVVTNPQTRPVFPFEETNPRFLTYLLTAARPAIEATASKSVVPFINSEQLSRIPVPVPSSDEQKQIVQFLDREAPRIDILIEKKQRLIELLEEERAALITQAVTKGLDPDVPMKDSGIEWLGEIPKHWDVQRIKSVAKLHTGGTPAGVSESAFEKDGIPWVKPDDLLGDRGVSTPERNLTMTAARNIGIVDPGSVLVCGIGSVGKVGYASTSVCTNQQINSISFGPRVHDHYARYAAVCLQGELLRYANKVTIPICNKSEMGQAPLCIPPLEEQRSIAAFLGRRTTQIDNLKNKNFDAIHRLQEYRAALIVAAVTGKIDVRETSAA